ncbi:MAG: AAA family ATPase [Gemmatimonadaceae bacterium]
MLLGESLVAAGLVTQNDVAAAIERQRETGGTLGDNLVSVGAIDRARLEEFLEQGPSRLGTVADTGLDPIFLQALALKVMYAHRVKKPIEVAGVLKLPASIVRELLESMRSYGLLESLGGDTTGRQLDIRYAVTAAGNVAVQDALKHSLYTGPAPVPLSQWQAQVERQRITNDRVDQAAIATSLESLVIAPELVARLGPGANAGRGMLLYGAPGDGKTSIARAIAKSFTHSIWVPHAIEVEHEVIKLYDPAMHVETSPAVDAASDLRPSARRGLVSAEDGRWVRCLRPVVLTGGELTMDMLELRYDNVGKYYEAPLHTKMTGGVFIVDDFGRQIAKPEQVLNRWTLPLESRIDFLTLHTGKKFVVVFDGLVIFSTNLTPRSIMDAAMMRRIPYNFFIAPPTEAEYLAIFKRACEAAALTFDPHVVRAVMERLYKEEKLPMARFHPRFIVDHVVARCNYEGRDAGLELDLVMDAAEHLYTHQ